MAFRWRADESPTLNAVFVAKNVIFHGIQTSIDKEPYSFVIFQGVEPGPHDPPLDPRMRFFCESSANFQMTACEFDQEMSQPQTCR